MATKDKKDEKEPEVRLSGTGRPLGAHEGDPKLAAEANVTDQVRKARLAEAEAEKALEEGEKPPTDLPFDTPSELADAADK